MPRVTQREWLSCRTLRAKKGTLPFFVWMIRRNDTVRLLAPSSTIRLIVFGAVVCIVFMLPLKGASVASCNELLALSSRVIVPIVDINLLTLSM